MSPSFSSKVSARLLGDSPCRYLKQNLPVMDDDLGDANPHPLEVALCFEHIWTEPSRPTREKLGKAKKVFMSQDAVGQSFFCFLLSSNQLNLVKFKYANDDGVTIIFGTVEKIPALDAVPVEELNMILVLEPTGSIQLLSGCSRVGKTLFPPSSTTLLSQEISALAIDIKAGDPFSGSDFCLSTPEPATVKRPAPFPHIEPIINHKLKKDFICYTPVSFDQNNSAIVGVRDPCNRQVTFVYNSGTMIRATLPRVATSLVSKGLETVKQLLPRELALQVHGAWFSKRHAPGPNPTQEAEWDMFCKCILALCGYQVDNLDLSSLSSPGDMNQGCPGPKKSKTECGTDGDWQYLLDSPQHVHSGHSLSEILKLQHVTREPYDTNQSPGSKPVGEINPSAPLFSYIPSIFWSLHLLYEELKLDVCLYSELPYIANLLSRLAFDLKLSKYLHHYWKDFPETGSPISETRGSQLSSDLLLKLNVSNIISVSPPCIYTHLSKVTLNQAVSPFPIISSVNSSIKLLTACTVTLGSRQPSMAVNLELYLKPLSQPGRPATHLTPIIIGRSREQTVAELISASGWDRVRISNLPTSLALPIYSALASCRLDPDPTWSVQILELIGREDLAENQSQTAGDKSYRCIEETLDGLEGLDCEISRLRWPKDLRTVEARRVLQSCKPVVVSIEKVV